MLRVDHKLAPTFLISLDIISFEEILIGCNLRKKMCVRAFRLEHWLGERHHIALSGGLLEG